MNAIKKNLPKLLLLPYFIAVSAMLVLDGGDKKIIPFMILSIITSLYLYKNEVLIKNIRSPLIWLISALCAYTVFSYCYHGASSREMRALIGVTLFIIVFPYQSLTKKAMQWIVLIGSISIFINSLYFNIYLGIDRHAGYINPIPYATACALISVIAFSLLIEKSPAKEKLLPSIAFLLSLPPIILSETRGIWLALTISIVSIIIVKCITNPPSIKQLLFTVTCTTIITISGGLLFKDKLVQRYANTVYEITKIQSNNYNTSVGIRLQLWMLAPELIKIEPLLGHGNEQQKILKIKLDNNDISNQVFNYASQHYHNQFLNNMVKSGIFGLVLILGILFYPLMVIKSLPPLDKHITIGLVSLFFIAGLTDVPFNHPQPLILYLLFIAPICSRCMRTYND